MRENVHDKKYGVMMPLDQKSSNMWLIYLLSEFAEYLFPSEELIPSLGIEISAVRRGPARLCRLNTLFQEHGPWSSH